MKPSSPFVFSSFRVFVILFVSSCGYHSGLVDWDKSSSPTAGSILASPAASGEAPTIQPNATPTAGTATPTTLTVDSNTNCREGPGTTYTVVIVLVPGTTYQIIARAQDNKFWIITEIGKSTTCWVPAEMSNAFGNVTLLPVITPSAPTASAAGSVSAPTFPKQGWSIYCYGTGQADITLNWNDKSNNETGYRILRNNTVIAELPANSTNYFETITLLSGQSVSYQIQAYNATSFANLTVTMNCP